MDAIQKAARVEKQALAGEELALINRQALKELTEEEVFVFRVAGGDQTEPLIAAIEGGILREVSVGCQVAKAICSICGTDRRETYCGHCPGQEYEGKRCHIDLDNPTDAYELSFVAVPAQKGAGVIKHYGGKGEPDDLPRPGEEAPALTLRMRLMEASLALMEMEE